jgi:hypothetical protein
MSAMTHGSPLRPPPRRWSARTGGAGLVAAFCIALTVLTLGAGRAEAFPCGQPAPARTLSAVSEDECRRPGVRERPPQEKTDFVSLALFVAVLGGVMAVPLNYSKRGPEQRQ